MILSRNSFISVQCDEVMDDGSSVLMYLGGTSLVAGFVTLRIQEPKSGIVKSCTMYCSLSLVSITLNAVLTYI